MLVDEIELRLEAGDGGRGAVAFTKVRLAQGPNGGDGGRGADVYFEGVSDINALAALSNKKIIQASDGENGRGSFVDGKRGEDLFVRIPVGTSILNTDTGFIQEMDAVGQRILAAGGGKGGRGNFKFRSPVNTTPREFEYGTEGDVANYRLSLKLIADVGLVGLPNAGKSSLLNELTRARSRVANYPFTTLEPHLGSYYGTIIADIPGLIEGASEGKGLGDKFLKHIERTRELFHLVSAQSHDPVHDYRIVEQELRKYDPRLPEKPTRVFVSKCDEVSKERLAEILAALEAIGVHATPISVLEPHTLEPLKKALTTRN